MAFVRTCSAILETLETRRLLSGTITGFVRHDTDNNGTADQPLGSVSVFFDLNQNDQLDEGEPKVFTEPGSSGVNEGRYTFTDLAPGTYRVRVQPAHFHRVFQPAANNGTYVISITGNETIPGKDFGVYDVAATGGKVFYDTNSNGAYDNGEALVVGATAYIDANGNGQFDNGERTNTTRDYISYFNQNYNFRDLDPGTYTMRLTNLPAGYTATPAFRTSTVLAGQETENDNFALVPTGNPPPTGSGLKVDFNNDGKTDVLVPTGSSTVAWMMNGTQRITTQPLTGPGAGWSLGTAADFNGDGFSDVVYHNNSTGASQIWLHQGMNSTEQVNLPTLGNTNWRIVAAGDFNNDNQSDIVWRNNITGQNTLWLMNNTTVASFRAIPSTGNQSWLIAGVGDFNNDGYDDIVWRNASTGKNTLWLMNNQQRISQFKALDSSANQVWQVLGVDDYDNDGDPDLFWHNASTNKNILWTYNGLQRDRFLSVMT